MNAQRRNPRVVLAILAALLAALLVSACGGSGNSGSSGSTASSQNAAATTTTSGTTTTASAGRSAFTACLKSHGVKLPSNGLGRGRRFPGDGTGTVPNGSGAANGSGAPSGGGPGGFPGGGLAGGNSKLAKAFQACRPKLGNHAGFGGRFGARPGGTGAGGSRPHFTTAVLKSYVACIRKSGYAAMPEPKASGDGSIFPADVEKNAQFQAANKKCQGILFKELRRPGSGAGTTGGGSGSGTITVGASSTTTSA